MDNEHEHILEIKQAAWVGRLKNLSLFDKVEDDILWDLGANVSPRYIGDDMILLLGLTDDQARQMETEENEGGSLFHTVEKWNPRMRPGHRLTWIHCWGIPLMAWNIQQMKKIVAGIGDVVEVDDNIEGPRKMDMARILIKTPWRPLIQHTVWVHIQEEIFQVHIIEECGTPSNTCLCRRDTEYSSSDEILSKESEGGSLWWILGQTTKEKEGSSSWTVAPSSQEGRHDPCTLEENDATTGDATSSERRSKHRAPKKADGGQTQTHNGTVTPRRVMAAQR